MLSSLPTVKWKVDWISRSSPMAPSATRAATRSNWPWNRKTNASQSSVPVARATARTCSVSARVPHSGFSQSTGRPARSARIVHSACSELGSAM